MKEATQSQFISVETGTSLSKNLAQITKLEGVGYEVRAEGSTRNNDKGIESILAVFNNFKNSDVRVIIEGIEATDEATIQDVFQVLNQDLDLTKIHYSFLVKIPSNFRPEFSVNNFTALWKKFTKTRVGDTADVDVDLIQ